MHKYSRSSFSGKKSYKTRCIKLNIRASYFSPNSAIFHPDFEHFWKPRSAIFSQKSLEISQCMYFVQNSLTLFGVNEGIAEIRMYIQDFDHIYDNSIFPNPSLAIDSS